MKLYIYFFDVKMILTALIMTKRNTSNMIEFAVSVGGKDSSTVFIIV